MAPIKSASAARVNREHLHQKTSPKARRKTAAETLNPKVRSQNLVPNPMMVVSLLSNPALNLLTLENLPSNPERSLPTLANRESNLPTLANQRPRRMPENLRLENPRRQSMQASVVAPTSTQTLQTAGNAGLSARER